MQYQIITTGECWWQLDVQAGIYEAFILSEKTALDTARAELIISGYSKNGSIYGR